MATVHLTSPVLTSLLTGAGKLVSGSVHPVYMLKLGSQCEENPTPSLSPVVTINQTTHDLNSSKSPNSTNAAAKKNSLSFNYS